MSVEEGAAWTWDTLEYRLAREQLDVSSDGGRFIRHGTVKPQFQLVSDILITREHRLHNVLSSPSVWSV